MLFGITMFYADVSHGSEDERRGRTHRCARRVLYAVSAKRMRDSVVRCILKIGAFVLSSYFIIM